MKLKKLMAVGLAATMVMGSSVVAFAADTSTVTENGSGTLEGIVNTDVYSVVLPTTGANTLDYIADPQGLIAKTDSAHYTDKTFGEGTIFFSNSADDKEYDYSNKSDKLTVTNKSSKAVKLTVSAKATVGTSGKDAALAASDSLSESAPEVYLAITDGTDDNTKTLQAAEQTITQVLGAAPEGAYEYTYEGSQYNYALKDDVSSYKFAEYSVYITGAASENGWEEATTVPEIEVVWAAEFAGDSDTVTVETPEQGSTSYVSKNTITLSSPSVTLSMPSGVTVSSVVVNNPNGKITWTNGQQYSISGKTLTVNANPINAQAGNTVTITYSNGHTDTLTISK